MQLKEQWIREGFSSYYVVKKEKKLTYEKNILRYHTLTCLLPCEFRMQDEEEYYYYETGIYTNLKDRINILEPELFFAYLLEAFEEMESYLLELDHLKLDPQFVFLDKENQPVFCYQPEYEKNIFEQLRDFLEECIELMNGDDKKKVRFYYEFHSFLVKEKPNMQQMKEYLDMTPKKMESKKAYNIEEIEEPTEDTYTETEIYETEERITGNIKWKMFICIILWIMGVVGFVYFVIQILGYGFYYVFTVGFLISMIIIFLGGYGFYKLWKKEKNKSLIVDSSENDITTLLEDRTTLLEEKNDKTVLLMEEPIGKLVPKDKDSEEISINENEFIIGSSMEGTDYQIEKVGISRRHMKIYKEKENIWCEDLDSTNGVKVNGRKIKKVKLRSGDRIKIGLEEFIFQEI